MIEKFLGGDIIRIDRPLIDCEMHACVIYFMFGDKAIVLRLPPLFESHGGQPKNGDKIVLIKDTEFPLYHVFIFANYRVLRIFSVDCESVTEA